ncbi:pyrimidine/purine nucleoside phosphorylase [Algibacillus agarilyticus]|uniref:pyrimidine/purine nucleoside phosphorylase n=1 Tax=Algibacillus agarilyticus TaxID=2234133 RepID=UPI000DD02CB6|nr:pyrimidine/purine nucleoside phosphorylase [Algibacillus agarilyticus]
MSEFTEVSIVRNANIYFDGKVTSRIVKFANGDIKTLGIMMPGDYEFGTEQKEIMEIQQGNVDIQLKGESEWTRINAGEQFIVPANSSFKINALDVIDYCCTYVD